MSHNNKRRQFLILISLFCITVVAHASLPVSGERNQLINPGEIPNGLSASDWGDIQTQVSAGKYKAYPDVNGGYISSNPAHGWQIRYSDDGTTTLFSQDHATSAYRLGFKLSAIGYSQLNPLHRPQQITAQSSTVTYQWSDTLRERWVNSNNNLEQWFILDKRSTGAIKQQPLTVQMTLDSDLKAILRGNAISFTTPSGSTISYNKLKVWDANGRELPATMQLAGQTLSLIVEDAHASYPLTIDPSVQKQAYLKASNTETSGTDARFGAEGFGYSVSISGDTLVVGAPYEDSGVNGDQTDNSTENAGAVFVFVRTGETWIQQAYLKASTAQENDRFGTVLSISGDTLAVSGNEAVSIFVRSEGNWIQQAYLEVSNNEAYGFGSSLSISGNTLIIGARGDNSNATGVNGDQNDNSSLDSGAAYIFVRNGNRWSQQAYLKASNTDRDDVFGSSVAISENTVVIGAPGEGSNATGVNGDQNDNSASSAGAGAAYVFVRNGNTWTQQAYLKTSNTNNGHPFIGYAFGGSVSIYGDTLVVGYTGDDSNATGVNGNQNDHTAHTAGAAYVFIRNGNTWSQQAYIKASNAGAFDQFGSNVLLFADTLVVGARGEASVAKGVNGDQNDNSADISGAAYLFVRNGNTWSQRAYLKASNTDFGDRFSGSMSISDDTLIIGAPSEDSNATGVNGDQNNDSAGGSGAVYAFSINTKVNTPNNELNIQQQAYLKASNTDEYFSGIVGSSDHFGASVSISGNTMVVGARFEDGAASGVNGDQNNHTAFHSGAAYVFVYDGNIWSQQAYLKASNSEGGDEFGASVSISGDTVVIGAPREAGTAFGVNGEQNDNHIVTGAAYVFVRSGNIWNQQAYLKPDSQSSSGGFGNTVSISGDTLVTGDAVFVRTNNIWRQQAILQASNADFGDGFASSVSISADTIVVGAPHEDSNTTGVNGDESDNSIDRSGAAYVFVRNGETWSQQAYLKASNTDGEDRFGHSVSISSDTLVVSALREAGSARGVNGDENDNSFDSSTGAAYVFVRNGNSWSQQAYLKASNTDSGDLFGSAVSISGDRLVVGATSEASNTTGVDGDQSDNSAHRSGAAYVFERSDNTWSQQAYLKAFNTGAGDRFGEAVSVSSDLLVIGASAEDSNAKGVNSHQNNELGLDSGAAYVFDMGTTTTQRSMDVDGNGNADALTDGLLFIRYMFGIRGESLIVETVASDCVHCSATELEAILAQSVTDDTADIDGNGEVDALTDGLLILRYLFDIRGDALIENSVAEDCSRCTAPDIETYIQGLMP